MLSLRALLSITILAGVAGAIAEGCGSTSTSDSDASAPQPNPSSMPAEGGTPRVPPTSEQDAEARPEGGDGNRDGSTTSTGRYGSNGMSSVTTSTFSVTGSAGSPFDVNVYLPSGAGPFPVVILSSGGLQKAAAYTPYAQRLASWGIIAITRDDPGLLANVDDLVANVAYLVTTWLPAQNSAAGGKLVGKVDVAKIGLAGHSRGARVSLIAAAGEARGKIKGFFGLDPVDDRAPYARTGIATVNVPLAFIGETTDSAAGNCAPAGSNFEFLYSLAASPIVAITVANADHTMFQDQTSCTFCGVCTKGTALPSAVLSTSIRYLTAFFARELLGDTSVGAAFQGAGAATDVASKIITIVSK